MPQRYKLRLGDGTVLSVDSEGLRAWADDLEATVQAIGSWRWQPLQEVLAQDEAAARLAQALVPPTPRGAPAPPPPAAGPVSGTAPSPRAAQSGRPPEQLPPLELPDFGTPPAASGPSLQVLADDPVAARSGAAFDSATADENVPVIPLKPLAEEPEFRSSWSADGTAVADQDDDAELQRGRLDGPLLQALEALGGFLSRALRPLTPLAHRLTAKRPRPPAPRVESAAEPLDESLDEPVAERPSAWKQAAGWLGALRARIRRAEDQEPVAPLAPPPETAAPVAAPPRAPQPPVWSAAPSSAPIVPADPVEAPPVPVGQIKTLPLKPMRVPREAPIVYEDAGPSLPWPLVWRWTKRALVLGALAAAALYGFRERDRWFERAGRAGQALFAQLDRLVFSRERRETERKALEQASAQLPQLRPETIRLVFSRFPAGVAEASEVFEITWDAADRGRSALEAAKAAELASLQRELLAALSRTERSQVAEYDRTRARRPVFPFENPRVMQLVAKGVHALPAERRERLQALQHEAVVAVLDAPAGAPEAR
jgi:hypothetical protein